MTDDTADTTEVGSTPNDSTPGDGSPPETATTAAAETDAAETSSTDPVETTDAILVGSVAGSDGKTAVGLALARLAQERGLDVGYAKPKGTRLRSRVGKTLDEDPMLARELLGTNNEIHEMEPVVYSPTFVEGAIEGREEPAVLQDRVRESFTTVAEGRDLVVIEGGDSLATGSAVGLSDPEVAELLNARILLLADHDEPGDVDDVLAAADDAGDRLDGVLFNRIADANYETVAADLVPFLEGRGVPSVGVIPREPSLAGVDVATLTDELGAETLTDAPDGGLVRGFLVGAMGGDAALRHIRRRRDVAVITGGDRSDVLTAAIDAGGVSCLVLTGGHRPSGAILGKAETAGVPVLLVDTDTLTAIERAEDVVHDGRTRDAETVATMRELLTDHADVEALLDL